MKSSRRTFLIASIGAASSLAMSQRGFAQAAKLDESDPAAVALGYRHDATKVDKAKFPKYKAGEDCGNCQFYQGGTADWGGCPLFAGKEVSKQGWCNGYVKKA